MEVNEVLSLIGLTPEDGKEIEKETIINHMNSAFVPVTELNDKHPAVEKIIGSSFGQKMGSLTTSLIAAAKENGLDVKHSDFKDKKIDDIIPVIFGSFKERIEAVKKPDSKLQEELDRWKNEASGYQSSLQKLENEKNDLITNFDNEKKGWLVNHAENEAWGTVKFSPTVNDLMKRGFKDAIKEKYDFITENDGKVWPVYKTGDKKGSRVQNPNNVSTVMTVSELLNHEAKAEGLIAAANEGNPGGKPNGTKPTGQQSPTPQNVRVNPRFANQSA